MNLGVNSWSFGTLLLLYFDPSPRAIYSVSKLWFGRDYFQKCQNLEKSFHVFLDPFHRKTPFLSFETVFWASTVTFHRISAGADFSHALFMSCRISHSGTTCQAQTSIKPAVNIKFTILHNIRPTSHHGLRTDVSLCLIFIVVKGTAVYMPRCVHADSQKRFTPASSAALLAEYGFQKSQLDVACFLSLADLITKYLESNYDNV